MLTKLEDPSERATDVPVQRLNLGESTANDDPINIFG
jgi:hypothetical protein